MKKVLVTGADGFIGSHLVEQLILNGYDVRCLSYYNSFNTWGWIDTIDKNIKDSIEVISSDIRDPHSVMSLVKGCNIVYHLAALIGIPFSYNSPDLYIDTNIKGTLNILQASKNYNVDKVLVTSTSEVYGSAIYTPIDENHPLQGQSPYSATKISSDKLAESFHKSFDTPVAIVRPFNTYGPRQSLRAVIPTIITQLLLGKKEIYLGSTNTTRDFNYILDTVNGFIEIEKSNKTIGEEINIASQVEISIEDLGSILIELINPNANLVLDKNRLRPENSEVTRLLGSNKKIKSLTNWKEYYDLRSGLIETIKWIDKNMDKYKSEIYNI